MYEAPCAMNLVWGGEDGAVTQFGGTLRFMLPAVGSMPVAVGR